MATKPKMMADGATGKVAIYTIDDSNPTDRAPLDSPDSYLSRILFHSDLEYPQIVTKVSGSLSLAARSANTDQVTTGHTLFAHGLSGQPLVFGVLTGISANPVPLAGSVPYQIDQYGFGRWLSLGADATNVVMAESYITQRGGGISSSSVSYTVWVTNFFLDRATPMPTPTSEMLFVDPTHFRAGGGKFDAANRYIRTASSGKEFAVVQGKTVAISSVNGDFKRGWRYSVDGYVQLAANYDFGGAGSPALPTITFTASVTDAKTQ